MEKKQLLRCTCLYTATNKEHILCILFTMYRLHFAIRKMQQKTKSFDRRINTMQFNAFTNGANGNNITEYSNRFFAMNKKKKNNYFITYIVQCPYCGIVGKLLII